MDGSSRLLVWNYDPAEKARLDAVLAEIKAPPAVTIRDTQGHLTLREIIHADLDGEPVFDCREKIVLFYNIPHKGVYLLLQVFKTSDLPRPIYAVVTEHSINWSFADLVEHLVAERDAMEPAGSNGN